MRLATTTISLSKYLYSALIVLMLFLPWSNSNATSTSSSGITVIMSTPQGNGGKGGGGGGETDNPPSIGAVSTSIGATTSTISWTASDDKGILSSSFSYGTDLNYNQNNAVTSPGAAMYQTQLQNLLPNTTYYYRIVVNDTINQTAVQTGTFITTGNAQNPDLIPPTISGVQVSALDVSATVVWSTNENSVGQIKYGFTGNYGSITDLETTPATNHSQSVAGLIPNTTYHYQILATDGSGNATSTADATFKTQTDNVPPANVSGFTLNTGASSFTLNWTNPRDFDFSGVRVVRKTGNQASQTINDGTVVYTGSGTTLTDQNVRVNTTYTYTVFSFDTSNNYSQGNFVSGKITPPVVPEVCNNNIDDDGNGLTDCADPACSSAQVCKQLPATETSCVNVVDDDGDGKADCADSDCALDPVCKKPTPEICNNNIDDDGNGLADCADSACVGFASCAKNDTKDNYNPPDTTVPQSGRVSTEEVAYFTGSRLIRLYPLNNTITNLAGASFTVAIPVSVLYNKPISIVAKVDGNQNYRFALSPSNNTYYTDITFPQVGEHILYTEIDYGNNQIDVSRLTLKSLAYGSITSNDAAVEGALVTLYTEGGSQVNTQQYGYANPEQTTINGTYGWVVPNGRYYITITKSGFYDRTISSFSVDNNVVRVSASLVAKPPKLLDDLTATSTLLETTQIVAKNVVENVKAISQRSIQQINDFSNKPEVKAAAGNVVVPSVVGVTAIGTAALVSWADIIPFLRLLFLQPLMLLGLRKKEGWGQVYNTLSKLPVDLVTLRLVQADTGRVLQTKVTDKQGRYAFVVSPGVYRIEAIKNNFTFPSLLLKGARDDGRRVDIYHGEEIKVNEKDVVITANVPLDPVGEIKKPARIFWQQLGRRTQTVLSWVGFLVTLASLYIAPRWYVWILLGLHVLLLGVFRRLAMPPKVKSWGIVYDADNKAPVGRAVARLFNSQFNKLVATQITDQKGRYYFMAGDDRYYVTYDHPEYAPKKTDVLDLTGKDAQNITLDVDLKKASTLPPAPRGSTLSQSNTAPKVVPPTDENATVTPV